ncbi:MAG: division/cell wall cluster transcriptional repressor MraZ [Gemmatimonadetes bacterium]|nr:division/cell wall cluster transcriptional repressor MraZ [Gemmatimonadota bacterium]MXX72828.1 division/cell wall cluster transcriptional repressor MraZ [Gemmatimonadota bacterium]MYC92243.1 division/cell wall cluster transcriptional repressor MraZ [Gemmatimonadota bacterium]MYG37019.1 division/cell wall cluster transcriptional repressor MraZ [Gemmatimonadota bacterium]MYJ18981.1 division/cell wall cluster transcriptional repressor MraZ [Gemmatimonadota bacterium]
MSGFLGRHEYQIDGKGRVSFPSPFRRVVSGGPLVLLQWQTTHLDLFPPEKWAEIQENLIAHRRGREDRGAYIRTVSSNATEVEPDAHGRIRIPPGLRERVGLDDVALFIGALDRIEIWNPARFEEQFAREAEDDGFAAQIFG